MELPRLAAEVAEITRRLPELGAKKAELAKAKNFRVFLGPRVAHLPPPPFQCRRANTARGCL